ncbi:hypothetical protein J3D46_001763 [Paenarthrobacter sp. A20]|nr:hypothetical protein [Paenarthrobacter sp. A20]
MPRHAVHKWVLLGTTLFPWALGSYAVYVTSAQFSGLGIFESYRAFEAGSNLGNALWFLLWTGISAAVCWFLVRRPGPIGAVQSGCHALYCYGTPAALLVFPDAAMGFAVSHVRAFTDDTVLHSPVVEFLVVSGMGALACAFVMSLVFKIKKPRREA